MRWPRWRRRPRAEDLWTITPFPVEDVETMAQAYADRPYAVALFSEPLSGETLAAMGLDELIERHGTIDGWGDGTLTGVMEGEPVPYWPGSDFSPRLPDIDWGALGELSPPVEP